MPATLATVSAMYPMNSDWVKKLSTTCTTDSPSHSVNNVANAEMNMKPQRGRLDKRCSGGTGMVANSCSGSSAANSIFVDLTFVLVGSGSSLKA